MNQILQDPRLQILENWVTLLKVLGKWKSSSIIVVAMWLERVLQCGWNVLCNVLCNVFLQWVCNVVRMCFAMGFCNVVGMCFCNALSKRDNHMSLDRFFFSR